MRDRILGGDIIRTAFALGWPVMLANVAESLYLLLAIWDASWGLDKNEKVPIQERENFGTNHHCGKCGCKQ